MKEGIIMQRPKNMKNLTHSASKLNILYLGKEIVYTGEIHTLRPYRGEIINIAYYSDLDSVPYAEIKLKIWNNRTVTKILPLSDVVLVSSDKVKKAKNKKSKLAA